MRSGHCCRCGQPTYRRRRLYNTLQRYDWGTRDEPGTGFYWLESLSPMPMLTVGAFAFLCWKCGGDCPDRVPHRADRSNRRRARRLGLDFNTIVRKCVRNRLHGPRFREDLGLPTEPAT